MSSPAPLAKGRRSRKQTLGSENTETTLSSSAVSQSASLARAAAGVGDRRYRFSSRSERRVCAATDNFLYFVGDLFDRHAIVVGYSDDGLEFERRRELPLLPVLRPRDQDPGLRALPHRLSKLLGDPVGPTPFLIEAEDNDDGVGARNVFFQWLQAYLSGIVLTAQNNRRDLGLLQRLGHGVLKFVTFRLTDSCIRAHDGKLLRPFARLWRGIELAADVPDERVDVFRMD